MEGDNVKKMHRNCLRSRKKSSRQREIPAKIFGPLDKLECIVGNRFRLTQFFFAKIFPSSYRFNVYIYALAETYGEKRTYKLT